MDQPDHRPALAEPAPPPASPPRRTTARRFRWHEFLLLALVLFMTSCRTAPTPVPVNLTEPGWRLQQGQALWKPRRQSPELAGELVLGSRPDGQWFLQFSKPPLTLVTAQGSTVDWRIEFPAGQRRFAGRGQPPLAFSWLLLPRALAGEPLPARLDFHRVADGRWRLANPKSGESIEGFLSP